MRPVSRKREDANAIRRQVLLDAYGPRPDCYGAGIIPVCPREPHAAHDPHEIRTRARGGEITDPANVLPLCRPGHRWVTEHPAEAVELPPTRDGRPFLVHSWD